MLLLHAYTDNNATRIKFTKFRKRNKFFDELRVDFYVLFFFSFFIIQFLRRSTREKRNRLYKKKIFFELKR